MDDGVLMMDNDKRILVRFLGSLEGPTVAAILMLHLEILR